MTLRIDDSSHHFFIDVISPPLRQGLEFGPANFFATLIGGLPIAALEANLAGGVPLFNNINVVPAVSFTAECVVLMLKTESPQFPEQFILGNFEFGFIQGLKASNLHMDFWGRYAAHGRTVMDIAMPNAFQVDTDPAILPWTRISAKRFSVKNVTMATSKFNSLKISATFSDHPMYVFGHTVTNQNNSVPNFLRSVSFRREFETVFCFREKKTGDFTPVSTANWLIHYNHQVVNTGNGTGRTVTELANNHRFPTGGSPSDIGATARSLMTSAKAGAPITTATTINNAINSPGGRTVTTEDRNSDFEQSFWT
jgi:hypothetical protein